MIDFLKGTVGKDYFSDRLYGCQECIAEYLASKEPLSQPTNQSFTNRFIESRIIWIGSTAGFKEQARRILEPILFCQAIEIKDPTSLFFEDADKFL